MAGFVPEEAVYSPQFSTLGRAGRAGRAGGRGKGGLREVEQLVGREGGTKWTAE